MIKHLSFLLVFVSFSSFAQTLKVKNGISISSMDLTESEAVISGFEILNQNIVTYSFSFGLDYFESKYFYLSSEVGYLQKGGKEENEFLPSDNGARIKESWSYIHLNTTARFPIRFRNNTHIFIGAGPKLDILIDSNKFDSSIYEGYIINSTVFGAKGELGFVKDFEKIRVGLDFSYLYDFNNTGGTEFLEFKNNAYQIMASLGYKM
ncbi:PorT family protein [Subsaximicrobium wynnwilliamsii]|uniref:PorT family protein n=1 Tax=Subsaximicrobium wynnwilliamsii TaxID=291179 RepID=A0A5C6ZCQ4_9FLAO|nr:outer membrane beta-barrel protein [Subsaximicrobium wynnwilliamsii]TXD82199.1 PorT family protein [Subsaximicrobium wynnwilliamsii]TXD87839.1 PorT family protein [Subsaximicrobium wynnwilliamsii]TXE01789.1 PorT family protein [Subsaximicrobium wynnwilliamsii]